MSEIFSPSVCNFKAATIAQLRPLLPHEQPHYSLLFARILEIFIFTHFFHLTWLSTRILLNHWWHWVSQNALTARNSRQNESYEVITMNDACMPWPYNLLRSLLHQRKLHSNCVVVFVFIYVFFSHCALIPFSRHGLSLSQKSSSFRCCVSSPTLVALDENAIHFFFLCCVSV